MQGFNVVDETGKVSREMDIKIGWIGTHRRHSVACSKEVDSVLNPVLKFVDI